MDDNPKDYHEKRRSLRVDLEAERVLLRWCSKDGSEQMDDGICIDLSRKGVLFEYRKAFALGELVEVTFNPGTERQNTIQGQVCRCNQANANSFHIAMQLI